MREALVKFRQKSLGLMAPAFAALALGSASVLAPAQVSLTTVVEMAQQNSTAVKLANADLQRAQAALGQTQDAYIPNFVIGSQVGYSHGFPTGQPSVGNASMQSLVLSFSQRQYTKAARAGVEAANLSLKDAKEQVALDASTAYIEMDTVSSELALSANRNKMRPVLSPSRNSALKPGRSSQLFAAGKVDGGAAQAQPPAP
jgi:outer membrane protein TolC